MLASVSGLGKNESYTITTGHQALFIRRLAFAISHPGVTASIVGPRTMEQLETYLPAADMSLGTDVLDRIDQLVAPGVTINPEDNSYGAHELTPQARRR